MLRLETDDNVKSSMFSIRTKVYTISQIAEPKIDFTQPVVFVSLMQTLCSRKKTDDILSFSRYLEEIRNHFHSVLTIEDRDCTVEMIYDERVAVFRVDRSNNPNPPSGIGLVSFL
eukprot:TRINITY_DN1249_c0_g3_i1.p3 TRINITY_DN1249_c0_g3~~TRINITY_DN1249_c0_g3_i1.p3  ORF type:complete len:115 (-),score=15.07 TRINITY_DN1249_c0_g3_i1:507-851(-)